MEKLIKITGESANTTWMIDLQHRETLEDGRRFVVVRSPHKKRAKEFREEFHGNAIAVA
ncbi:hypothetical protein [Rhizobium sp. S163]|uniref:hypothetical protein n=1 Tax=Rhizobium sp. S163 TaxID=3055039 RepID=UPI0025A97546|nr:hypothetical protein [Rhizobium sp. S163]MDM9649314.1 hypothetical protein [Rhizobium sp. S163]